MISLLFWICYNSLLCNSVSFSNTKHSGVLLCISASNLLLIAMSFSSVEISRKSVLAAGLKKALR